MGKFFKFFLLTAGIFFFFVLTTPVWGKDRVITNVKVIHASTNQNYLDPALQDIISQLESVFKYTSYRLVEEKRLNQNLNQQGQVNLPGSRTLIVIPLDTDNKRIRYQISILKNQNSVFKTRILLRNNSSITIGGPQYKNGYLLFNISGSI